MHEPFVRYYNTNVAHEKYVLYNDNENQTKTGIYVSMSTVLPDNV